MGDSEIFGVGVFVTLWLVSFVGYSWYQLQRGYRGRLSATSIAPKLEAPLLAVTGRSDR